MRAVDVRQRRNRVGERAGGVLRLAGEHVEADTDVALADCLLQCSLIDDFGARGVDEIGTRLQLREHRRVHQAARLGVEREVNAQHVALLRHLLRRFRQRQRNRFVRDIVLAGGEAAAPDDGRHAEGVGAPGHLLPEVAGAEQPEEASVEPARFRILLLVPRAGPQIGDVVGHAAIERQQQRERELGDGDGVLAGAVRHVDAALRCRGDVDRVVAGAGADHQRQRAGLEHRRGDGGPADDEHIGRRIADRRGQRVVFEIRLIDDVAAGGFQAVETALLELVGDEHFHIRWINKPSRNFGSNQVDFGGMISPASETAIRSATLTGYSENPTAALPESTSVSSPLVPRAPPTKSMRLSVRTSAIFRTGASKCSCRTLTSRTSIGFGVRRSAFGVLVLVPGSGFSVLGSWFWVLGRSVCHARWKYIAISPRLAGAAGPGATSKRSRTALMNASGESAPRSFTIRLYGRICTWSCGKATPSIVAASAPAPRPGPRVRLAPSSALVRAALAAR